MIGRVPYCTQLLATSKVRKHSLILVTLDPQLARDEERRLLAEYESCHTEKHDAVRQLLKPRHRMVHAAYKRLVDALEVIRLKCKEKWLAVMAHRKKMRNEGVKDDRNET
jgi:hypothetical protein